MTIRATLFVLVCVLGTDVSAQNPPDPSRTPRRTASIAGRVIHPDGTAAVDARVAVYAVRDGAAAAIAGTTTSSYDGRYEITGLPAGTFIVGVTPQRAGGFGGDSTRPRELPVETMYPGVEDRDLALPIAVFEGVAAEGIDVWLAPAPRRFSIGGRVYWPEGIELQRLVIEYGGPDAIRRGVWVVDDPGGLFTIEGVAQETYVLLARADTDAGPLIGLASTEVVFGSVEDVRLTLARPGAIEGRIVTDVATTTPLGTLRVRPVQQLLTLSPLYPEESATVSDDGRFVIRALRGEYALAVEGLPPGWRVKRIRGGGRELSEDDVVPVAPGEVVSTIEIVIGNGAT